jgi:hypothetical protein
MARHRAVVPKMKFKQSEDARLLEIVTKLGADNWRQVAAEMEGRTPRQCRERWMNYVNPKIMNNQWSETEDEILLKTHREIGPKWATIAAFLPGRPKNSIKNRFWLLERNSAHGLRSFNPSTREVPPLVPPPITKEQQEVDPDPFGFLDVCQNEGILEWERGESTPKNTRYFTFYT